MIERFLGRPHQDRERNPGHRRDRPQALRCRASPCRGRSCERPISTPDDDADRRRQREADQDALHADQNVDVELAVLHVSDERVQHHAAAPARCSKRMKKLKIVDAGEVPEQDAGRRATTAARSSFAASRTNRPARRRAPGRRAGWSASGGSARLRPPVAAARRIVGSRGTAGSSSILVASASVEFVIIPFPAFRGLGQAKRRTRSGSPRVRVAIAHEANELQACS